MNPIFNAISSLMTDITQFLQDIHRSRGGNSKVATGQPASEVSLMQLYRLTRGRESIAPAVGAILVNRFEA